MAGRYSPEQYASFRPKKGAYDVKPDEKASKDADLWRFIGDIAPAAGTALGTIGGGIVGGVLGGGVGAVPGATIGAGLGGALGSAVGAGAHGHSNNLEAPKIDEANEKDRRRQEFMSILSSLRR